MSTCRTISKFPCSQVLTLFDDVDNVIGVEAELVCVLSVVGVQSFALGHLGFGFGRRLGPPSSRWRPADRRSVGSETRKGKERETSHDCRHLQDYRKILGRSGCEANSGE